MLEHEWGPGQLRGAARHFAIRVYLGKGFALDIPAVPRRQSRSGRVRALRGITWTHAYFPLVRHAKVEAPRGARRRSVIDCLEAIMREGNLNSRTTPQGSPPEA